jgi:hypothetical protein
MSDFPLVKDRLNEVHAVLERLSVPQLISLSHALGIRKLPKRPVVDHTLRVKEELAGMLKGYAYDLRCNLFDIRRSKGGKLNQVQLDESERVMEQARQLPVMSTTRRLAENTLYLEEWALSDENELSTDVAKKFEEKAVIISSGCKKIKALLEAELAKCETIDDLVLQCRARSAKRDRNSWRDTPFPQTYQYNDILSGMKWASDALERARFNKNEYEQFVAGCEDYISMPVIVEENEEDDDDSTPTPSPPRKRKKTFHVR